MKILSCNPYNHSYTPSFKANLNSRKPCFSQKDFFIKIRGYGRNTNWAEVIKETADKAVSMIRSGWNAEEVLKTITEGVQKANMYPYDLRKRTHTGILRVERDGWESSSEWRGKLMATPYGKEGLMQYKPYEERLDERIKKPLKNPFAGKLGLTQPGIIKGEKCLWHADYGFIEEFFKQIDSIYKHLQKYYINKDIQKENLKSINNQIAKIRWIMAHVTPWERGSDSISNVFMRALYKSMGIKAYPPAKGISYDMEAYCTELEDYKKNFPRLFEKLPEIIE